MAFSRHAGATRSFYDGGLDDETKHYIGVLDPGSQQVGVLLWALGGSGRDRALLLGVFQSL